MNEENSYTNREINVFIKDIREVLARIEAQTTKTNGRVGRLEVWQGYIKGGMAIIALVLLPILFKLIK